MSEVTKIKYRNDGSIAETVIETIIDDNSDRIFELERQLHEQYAINNNSNAGVLMSLIGSLLVVLTGYGYVLYQFHLPESKVSLGMVCLTAVATSLIMALLYCICVYLGAGQRLEQFITYAIRRKYYHCKNVFNLDSSIYPNGYHPFGKSKSNFVQGIYNELSKAFFGILYILPIGIVVVTQSINGCILYYLGTLILVYIISCYKDLQYGKYKKRERDYMELFKIEKTRKETCEKDKEETVTTSLKFESNWFVYVLLFSIVACFAINEICSCSESRNNKSTKLTNNETSKIICNMQCGNCSE